MDLMREAGLAVRLDTAGNIIGRREGSEPGLPPIMSGSHIDSVPSGAGHDAQDMAQIAPTGMIFVPSAKGISHSPKEFTSAKDMANGASVLLRTVLEIDGGALE